MDVLAGAHLFQHLFDSGYKTSDKARLYSAMNHIGLTILAVVMVICIMLSMIHHLLLFYRYCYLETSQFDHDNKDTKTDRYI